jgi:hypothetical protein
LTAGAICDVSVLPAAGPSRPSPNQTTHADTDIFRRFLDCFPWQINGKTLLEQQMHQHKWHALRAAKDKHARKKNM